MNDHESQAALQFEVQKLEKKILTPGSRIRSRGSGRERLVVGHQEDTYFLAVRTEPDGSQRVDCIAIDKAKKVAELVARDLDYTVTSDSEVEPPAKEITADQITVGGWIVSESGSLRKITDVAGDTVTTIKKDGDSFQNKSISMTFNLLNQNTNEWVYAVLSPSKNTEILETFFAKKDTAVLGNTPENALKKTVELFQSPSGMNIVAGCDVGYQEGSRRNKPNQDRVYINPRKEEFAVIDGAGGLQGGEVAAQTLADAFAASEKSFEERIISARAELKQKADNGEVDSEASAAYISAEIIRENGKIFVKETHLGDASMLILDENGTIVHQSKQDSFARAIEKDPKAAARSNVRHVLTKAFTQKEEKADPPSLFEVRAGYRVIMMSDGIEDNLLPEEIAELVKGKTPEQAMNILSDVTTARIKNNDTLREEKPEPDQNYSDGYYQKPKPDNRSLIIFDIA